MTLLGIHICAGCGAEHNSTNPTYCPPDWHWHGSSLLCCGCSSAKNESPPINRSFSAGTIAMASGEILKIEPTPKHEFRLRTGTMLDLKSPDYGTVHIRDIASGLARTCRFNGQIDGWWPVAAHSVVGSIIAPPHIAYAFLMHDAVEAVLGDVINPLKSLLPEYKRLEAMHESRCFSAFGVMMRECHDEVKRIDRIMLAAEDVTIRHIKPETAFAKLTIAEAELGAKAVEIIETEEMVISGVWHWEQAFLDMFYQIAPLNIAANQIRPLAQEEMAA
jgi:hypothetical protein